ncbi:MAG: hypothetical protein AAGU21_13930 [Solidesulfovibrio sp.]|uniref:hypothetical protein n=1 Tax=Solidesulfovibrio sp. TaxID=2910990 RepID=UPI0031592A47
MACRLWEISENLHRAELSNVERSKLIEEWRELTREKVRQVAAPDGGEQPKEQGFRKTAKELGVDERVVRRAHKIATMSPEAHEARESGLDDNQSILNPDVAREFSLIGSGQSIPINHQGLHHGYFLPKEAILPLFHTSLRPGVLHLPDTPLNHDIVGAAKDAYDSSARRRSLGEPIFYLIEFSDSFLCDTCE